MRSKLRTAMLLCIAAAVFFASGCSIKITLSSEGSGVSYGSDTLFRTHSSSGGQSESVSDYEVTDTMEKYDYSLKNTLDEQQTSLYNRIAAMIENHCTCFDFENISNEDFKKSFYAVMYDHPEYISMGLNYTYKVRTTGDYIEFHAQPALLYEDMDKNIEAEKELEAVVSKIAEGAKAQADPYYTVKYVHDYIIDNTVYDTESLSNIDSSEGELVVASTAYGCLVQRKALCSGYSAAFQLIMQRLGIECGRINGTRTTESGAHQWNYVCLDGEYYFMDLTWDDPINENGGDTKTYDYFLISDDDLAYTHVSDRTLPQPQCSGTRYNYFRYNGLYSDEYYFGFVEDAANRMRGEGAFSVKFGDPQQLQYAVDDLIENQRLFELDFTNGGIFYSVSTSGCILNVSY